MAMTNCSDVERILADYSAGCLRWRRRRQVEAHLRSCPNCAREYAVLMAVCELLKQSPQKEPPANLWERTIRELTSRESAGPARRRSLPPAAGWALAAGTAAAVLVYVLVVMGRLPSVPAESVSFYLRTHHSASTPSVMLSDGVVGPILYAAPGKREGS